MSHESSYKRQKRSTDKKSNFYRKSQSRKLFIEVGQKGFLATCNFREKDCVRECYNILNQYADDTADEVAEQVVQTQAVEDTKEAAEPAEKVVETGADNSDSEEEDISTALEKQIQEANTVMADKKQRFQQVDTGVTNCVFIKSTLANPVELCHRIVKDISDNKKQIARFLLRFIPVEAVCKANVADIKEAAGRLFDQHFLNCPPKTFSIVINKRYNNSVDRDAIIKELASIISFKNLLHKVDLKNAETTVVLEIIKGLCCISVVPNYLQLKKYNILELGLADKKPDEIAKETNSGSGQPIDKEEDAVKTDDSLEPAVQELSVKADEKPSDES